jgi:hypothetical protein
MGLPDSPTQELDADDPGTTPYRGVCIYNCNPGTVTHLYSQSLRALIVNDVQTTGHIIGDYERIGQGLSVMRNAAVSHFLTNTTGEWMWFLDSDIYLPIDTLNLLLEVAHPDDAPIICGLYVSSLPEGMVPVAWGLDGQVLDPSWTQEQIGNGVRLVETTRMGAGCLFMHRDALWKMHANQPEDPWFGEHLVDGVRAGEDFTFCDRARAAGIKLHVDLGVDLGHVKTIVFSKQMLGNVTITTLSEEE